MDPKESTIRDCMAMMSNVYLPNSGVSQNVEKGLHKLNRVELQGLYVMLLTSIDNSRDSEGGE
jgi:hypothetical protein